MTGEKKHISEQTSPDLKQLYHSLEQRVEYILNIRDTTIRRRVMMDKLISLSAEELAETLHFILHNAQRGRKDFQEILSSIIDMEPLVSKYGVAYISKVCYIASHKGYEDVSSFLRRQPQNRGLEKDFPPDPNQLANELTLGERKSQAMSRNKEILEQLMFDPDPNIIRKLLMNPRLTLTMVVRIASRRPNRPDILKEVSRSPKWSAQYDVKLALARNPYTPPELTLKLMPSIRIQDLKEMAMDTMLQTDIRDVARKMIHERKGTDH